MIRMNSILFVLASTILVFGYESHAFIPLLRSASTLRPAPTSEISYGRKTVVVSYSFYPVVEAVEHIGYAAKVLIEHDVGKPLGSIQRIICVVDPDVEARFLVDITHLLLDFTVIFNFDGALLNFAQVVGRIAFIAIDFLPGHEFHYEEMAVQLVLLGVSIKRMAFAETKDSTPSALEKFDQLDHVGQETQCATDTDFSTVDESMLVEACEE